MKQGIIFSDINGTLIFHPEKHNVRELKRADGIVYVLDSAGKEHSTIDVGVDVSRLAYLSLETLELARKVSEIYDFVPISGAKRANVGRFIVAMNFVRAYILENGGVILDSNLQQDNKWFDRLKPEISYLADVSELLRTKGWVVYTQDRTAAIRIRPKDNPHKSRDEFEDLCNKFSLPVQLKKTKNFSVLDIIPVSSGKYNAMKYLTQKLGYNHRQTIGIGDDLNDLGLLHGTEIKYLLKSSAPEVLETAKKEDWCFSKGEHFDGINEILMDILAGAK